LFNPVFNCRTHIVIKRLKTHADEGLTPADEAGYVFLSQPPAPRFLASTPSLLGAMPTNLHVRAAVLVAVVNTVVDRLMERPPGSLSVF